jgi:hypothetical protein
VTSHRRRSLAAAVLVLFVLGCASVAPGNDPVVVHAERVLIAAPGIYDSGMTWAEKNKATIPVGTLAVLEGIRKDFPPAYRTADAALQLYKAAKSKDAADLLAKASAIEDFLSKLSGLIAAAGGPQLWPPGGTP